MKQYQLGLYEKAMPNLSWKEMLLLAKNSGFDFVELSIDASEERIARIRSTPLERRALHSLTEEIGIPFGTLNASALTKYSLGNDDVSLCSRGMEIAYGCIELAVDLGIRVVMIPGYDVYYGVSTKDTAERFLVNVTQLTAAASSAGVQLGFETMENDFMNTVEKAMRMISKVGSNYLQIYPDIGNMTNAAVLCGGDPLADLWCGKGHLVGLHLKETCPGRFREVPFGHGHVDFPGTIRTAWELGIRRFVTEFWYKDGGETPHVVNARFRALFRTLGYDR